MRRTNRRLLNDEWRFHFNGTAAENPRDDRGEQVTLPHTWNALDTMLPKGEDRYRRGAGWYTRTLPPLHIESERRVWIEIEAAAMRADVFLDTVRVGTHVGGYTAFTVELPQTNLADPQMLAIRVDNEPDADLIPSDRSDFFLYGGLTRNLWLYTTGPARLETLRVDYDVSHAAAQITAHVLVDGQITDGLRLHVELRGPDDVVVVRDDVALDGANVAIPLPVVHQPRLWSPDDPALYSLVVRLATKDDVWDEAIERIGLRWFEFPAGGKFALNGQPLRLNGTHRHEDWAGYGGAVPDRITRREFEMIRAAGFNFVRLGHYPQAPAALDACDELGLIVWEEVPWCRGGVGGSTFQQQTRQMLQEMIEQHRNHPSIVFWGLGNELDWESDHPDSTDELVLALLRELHDLAHMSDPHRLTALRRFEPGAQVVDVYSPSIWSGWYRGRYEDYEHALRDALQRYPRMLHIEWGGDSHVGRHSAETDVSIDRPSDHDHAEVPGLALGTDGPARASRDGDWSENYILDLMEWHLQVQARVPELAGAAQWVFKDFGTPLRPENPIPFVNQKGLIDRAGRPKDAFYLFQSYLTCAPMCYVESPTWPVRRGQADEPQRVRVYSNCHSVELWVNGVPAGVRTRDKRSFPAAGLVWQVVFQPGVNELRAVATSNRGEVAEHCITQEYVVGKAGTSTTLVGWSTPAPDNDDVIMVTVQLVDHAGTPCVTNHRRVCWSLRGEGALLTELGTPDGSRTVELANGRSSILVRLVPGKTTVVQAEAARIPPFTLTLCPPPQGGTNTIKLVE